MRLLLSRMPQMLLPLCLLSCKPTHAPTIPVRPVTPEPTVTVTPDRTPCLLPQWPAPIALTGTSLPNGGKVIDAKTGQSWDAAPGSALISKATLADIARYAHGTAVYFDASQLCLDDK